MSKYVDGFVLTVPKKNLPEYTKMAKVMAKLTKKYGALDYVESVGDDLSPDMGGMKVLRFPQMAKAKEDEVVVFSYIVFKSRAHRDKVNAMIMKDPAMDVFGGKDMVMPFDMKRMAYGGFKSIVSL